MANEEKKTSPLTAEQLKQASGGKVVDYAPGTPCPECGTPLIDTGLVDSRRAHASLCPSCMKTYSYWVLPD